MTVINREVFKSMAGKTYSFIEVETVAGQPFQVATMINGDVANDGDAVEEFTTEQQAMDYVAEQVTEDKDNAFHVIYEKLASKYGADIISYGDGCISFTLGTTKFSFGINYDPKDYEDVSLSADVIDEERDVDIVNMWQEWDYRKVSNFIRKHNK